MEQSLKRLEEQEQKYSAELDAALNEYAGLREQAQGFDPVQLYESKAGHPPRQGAGSGEPGTAGLRRKVQPAFDV